jgi:hypothetical protein
MKQTVIDVLKNQHTQSIKFEFTGSTGLQIKIGQNDFLNIVQKISQGVINVEQGNAPDGMAKYTAQDDGNSKANTMYIGKNTTSERVLNSLIVHETVHAIFDIKKITIPWLDNEVAAYIAQGFYIKSAGEDAGLSQEAYLGLEIARSFNSGDDFWMENLRDSLLNNPTYHDYIRKDFVGDG